MLWLVFWTEPLPNQALIISYQWSQLSYIVVGTPLAFRTCRHSSGVSFPSLFLSALLNIRLIWQETNIDIKLSSQRYWQRAGRNYNSIVRQYNVILYTNSYRPSTDRSVENSHSTGHYHNIRPTCCPWIQIHF